MMFASLTRRPGHQGKHNESSFDNKPENVIASKKFRMAPWSSE